MIVKYIKEGYFEKPADKLAKRSEMSAEDRVVKLSTSILREKVLNEFQQFMKLTNHKTLDSLYGFVFPLNYIFSRGEIKNKLNDKSKQLLSMWTNDRTESISVDISNKTITIDITYGANISITEDLIQHLPRITRSDFKEPYFEIYISELVYDFAQKIRETPTYSFKLQEEMINKRLTIYVESRGDKDDILKDYVIKLNPIHMFPNQDTYLELSMWWSDRYFDTIRTACREHEGTTLGAWIVKCIQSFFSFENTKRTIICWDSLKDKYIPIFLDEV